MYYNPLEQSVRTKLNTIQIPSINLWQFNNKKIIELLLL